MSEGLYKIAIKGPGIDITKEVSEEIGTQVVVLLMTGKPGGSKLSAVQEHQRAKAVDGQQLSIREFLGEHEAKRMPDKIACIGYYLQMHGEQATFTKDDLVTKFEEAAEPIPANLGRDIKWTLKVGWIALKPRTKGAYYVTGTGINAVKSRFSKEFVTKTKVTSALK